MQNRGKYGMKWVNKYIVILILLLSNLTHTYGQQDPMYTQYMFNIQVVNPAYVGIWDNMTFMALSRLQWVGITGAPETHSFSVHAPLRNENIGIGLTVVDNDQGLENRFAVFVDYAYRLKLSEKTSLRLGIKTTIQHYQNNFDAYELNPNFAAPRDPAFQGYIDQTFKPNFGVGAFLHSEQFYLGLSIPRIIESKYKAREGYLSTNGIEYTTNPELRHYFIIGGFVFDMGKKLKFKPTFSTRASIGVPVEFDVSANFLLNERLWLGGMYRSGDSYGAIVQWIINEKLRFGYAIDFTTTNLKRFHDGVHEIMISYELNLLRSRYTSPRYF